MNAPQVSVIVPVHDCARYLRPCLQSVMRQSLQAFEIILVDDASTDGSADIISELAANDERIRVITHSVNRGVSAARNRGIEVASGEYLVFLDGDDYWMSENMLSELYDIAVGQAVDIVEFGFFRSDAAVPRIEANPSRKIELHAGGAWTVRYNAWAKLVSRPLLMRCGIRFDPELVMGEDALFAVTLYCHADTMAAIDTPYYCYRIHPESTNTMQWGRNKLFCTVEWFQRAIDVLQNCDALAGRPDVLRSVAGERVRSLFNRLGPMALDVLDEEDLHEYIARWSGCLSAVDKAYREKMVIEDPAGLYRELLDVVERIDTGGFRRLFESKRYRERGIAVDHVTLTREQALRLGRSILQADRENIRCDFGNGVIATLPRSEAHQLARRLTENRNASITLRFR